MNLMLQYYSKENRIDIDGTYTFGVIENISHITDAQSFLTSYISSDFGNVDVDEPTLRVDMNYVEATVAYNSGDLYTPVHNNAPVYLAEKNELIYPCRQEGASHKHRHHRQYRQ